MSDDHKDFVHVLLFECLSCRLPVVSALTTESKSIEYVDLNLHNVACICGWSGEMSGLEAKRHWVEPWRPPPARVYEAD